MIMAMKIDYTMIITSAIIIATISLITTSTTAAAKAPGFINIVNLGAIPDGKTDSSPQFESAWASACSSSKPATIYVPSGKFFLRSAYFQGERCNNKAISFIIDGTLLAPTYYTKSSSDVWIQFEKATGVSISGGTLDGRGTALWACKASSGSCPSGATTLAFFNSRNIIINGLSSINSEKFHIVMDGCQNVKLQSITISAPGNSPNTDGIHIEYSSGVTVLNSRISTGDDCVSIGPGSSNLWIESITCGPGHGVSIGSLGWKAVEAGVQNVTLKTAMFRSTMNGVRIKTWARESNGFVKGVVFEDLTMVEVQNPVIIDQNYCPGDHDCPRQVSGVAISDVRYQDIHGTSATEIGVKLDCSKEHPCSGMKMEDVNLSYENRPAHTSCINAIGTTGGGAATVTHHATSTTCLRTTVSEGDWDRA